MSKTIRTASRRKSAPKSSTPSTEAAGALDSLAPAPNSPIVGQIMLAELSVAAAMEAAPANLGQLDRSPLQKPKPLRMVYLHAPFNRFVTGATEALLETPAMMSANERDFLYNLAKRYYRGVGRIVDAGVFLGGSTSCLGMGLQESPHLQTAISRWRKPVVGLDRGIVSATMPSFFARHGIGVGLTAGDSFVDLLENYLLPYSDLVELRIGDIVDVGQIEDRIEILFLDVVKSAAIANFVVEEYFTRLIPNRSLVIQKDYFSEGLPFVKISQEFFGDCFEYVGEVGSSAVFRCVMRITRPQVRKLIAGLEADTQLRLASVAMQRSLDPTRRLMVALCKTRLIRELKGIDAAKAYLAVAEGDYGAELRSSAPPRVHAALSETRAMCGLPVAKAELAAG